MHGLYVLPFHIFLLCYSFLSDTLKFFLCPVFLCLVHTHDTLVKSFRWSCEWIIIADISLTKYSSSCIICSRLIIERPIFHDGLRAPCFFIFFCMGFFSVSWPIFWLLVGIITMFYCSDSWFQLCNLARLCLSDSSSNFMNQ